MRTTQHSANDNNASSLLSAMRRHRPCAPTAVEAPVALLKGGYLEEEVRGVQGRMGRCEVMNFVLVLISYAIGQSLLKFS